MFHPANLKVTSTTQSAVEMRYTLTEDHLPQFEKQFGQWVVHYQHHGAIANLET